ncbi:MAG: hypothetical protein GY778_27895 [bacterium]|nr:hypothetical protein [bacterium]
MHTEHEQNRSVPPQPGDRSVRLPDDAPRVRVTAGAGTASQKSWYLRRPAAVIGSGSDADFPLCADDAGAGRGVIVNTGQAVLLKILQGECGPEVDGQRPGLTELNDGHLFRIGQTSIQVAIRSFGPEASPIAAADPCPFKMSRPVRIRIPGREDSRRIVEQCSVIGSAADAAVRLDGPTVKPEHALIFDVDGQAAVLNLAGESDALLNGEAFDLAPLLGGDRLQVGGIEVDVVRSGLAMASGSTPAPTPADPPMVVTPDEEAAAPSVAIGKASNALDELERKLEGLQADFDASWDRVNDWSERMTKKESTSATPASPPSSPTPEEEEFDQQDAALRGRLHELQCFQQELAAREADLQSQKDALEQERTEFDRRSEEFARRERALAWRERAAARQCADDARMPSSRG